LRFHKFKIRWCCRPHGHTPGANTRL
jgi:hypothetical protein